MKKEYIIYKLSEDMKNATRIENELFKKFDVKRGLRNEDGTGVLVGLTKIGNVVGYERIPGGGLKPIPGKLFYRGYDLEDLAHSIIKEKRFGFEEVAYLLLSGHLPDKEELASFCELINDNTPLEQKTKMNIIELEGNNIMNILARSVLEMYRFDPLDVYGGDFQSLLMLPDLGGTFDGEKYAAEGILLDETGQMPPEGKPIAWTIEIDVLKAVWQTETIPDDLYEALSEEDNVAQYIREQAEQHMITLTDAGVEDYLLEMCGAGWDEIEQMSKADLLLRCGGFERAETYTVAFATEGNTQYVHPELAGLRIPLDGYTAVVDYVRASFLGGCVVLHCEAPEGTALPNGTALPDVWRIYRNDEQNPAGEAGWARASGYAGVPGGVVDVNQPSICLYFAPCADLTSLRIVPEGEAGFTLNLSGEKGTE